MVTFGYAPEFVEIYREFLEQTPHMLDAMEEARQRGDVAAVSKCAHKLKGSALNFGFAGVSAPMTALERETKDQGVLDRAEERIRLARANFEAGRAEVFAARAI